MPTREKLPEDRQGITAHLVLQYAEEDSAGVPQARELDIYLTVNVFQDGRIAEMFCRAGHAGGRSQGWLDLVCTLASIALQHGVPLNTIVGKMRGQKFRPDGRLINPPECMQGPEGRWVLVSSPADAVAQYLAARFPGGRLPVGDPGKNHA